MTYAKNVLLTSLSPYPRKATYFLNEKSAVATQSPLALLQLISEKDIPEKIIVLCTEEIKEQQFIIVKKEILEELKNRNILIYEDDITGLNIPNGETPQELWEILRKILDKVPQGVHLTLDITSECQRKSLPRDIEFVYH